tara:strand:- start:131 stop:1030 length:900 start_codon:yes stop_codon:yes gene_type:complete
MSTYVFDIDGTICNNTYGEYEKAKPFLENIKEVNFLFEEGHYIKYFTARGSGTGKDWSRLTREQLRSWGAKYHELILGKPEGDFYIDDKGRNALSWDWNNRNNNFNEKDFKEIIKNDLSLSVRVIENFLSDENSIKSIEKIALSIKNSLKEGGKVIFAGNGGSFADSQHLSAEFVSRLCTERSPLASIALGTNSSISTAIGNDYGFENLFSRELEAIAKKEDIFIAFTTSGNSLNILKAIEKCKELSIKFFIITGASGGKCSQYENSLLKVPSNETTIIQQLHITIGHIICKLAEKDFI